MTISGLKSAASNSGSRSSATRSCRTTDALAAGSRKLESAIEAVPTNLTTGVDSLAVSSSPAFPSPSESPSAAGINVTRLLITRTCTPLNFTPSRNSAVAGSLRLSLPAGSTGAASPPSVDLASPSLVLAMRSMHDHGSSAVCMTASSPAPNTRTCTTPTDASSPSASTVGRLVREATVAWSRTYGIGVGATSVALGASYRVKLIASNCLRPVSENMTRRR
mmetsp:Transcript_14263/g.29980  ORF Transcript_14263/g.29980 Transcript_14263/m.29980 type:complete len:221 (+) Transcript_14263:196-858(+)